MALDPSPEPGEHGRIEPADYQARLDRITELFGTMVAQAGELSLRRCPYKNRFDECTASFGCRNQRFPEGKDGPKLCSAKDGDLNYKSAWETD